MKENSGCAFRKERIVAAIALIALILFIIIFCFIRMNRTQKSVSFACNPLDKNVSADMFISELRELYPKIIFPDDVGLIRLTGTVRNGHAVVESAEVYCFRRIQGSLLSGVCYSGVSCDVTSMATTRSWLDYARRYDKELTDADYMHGYTVKTDGVPLLCDVIEAWELGFTDNELRNFENADLTISISGTDDDDERPFIGVISLLPADKHPGYEHQWHFDSRADVTAF